MNFSAHSAKPLQFPLRLIPSLQNATAEEELSSSLRYAEKPELAHYPEPKLLDRLGEIGIMARVREATPRSSQKTKRFSRFQSFGGSAWPVLAQ
jgi:hypothetical protein